MQASMCLIIRFRALKISNITICCREKHAKITKNDEQNKQKQLPFDQKINKKYTRRKIEYSCVWRKKKKSASTHRKTKTHLLKVLREARILGQVPVRHRAPSIADGVLEVAGEDLRHRVLLLDVFHRVPCLTTEAFALHVLNKEQVRREKKQAQQKEPHKVRLIRVSTKSLSTQLLFFCFVFNTYFQV